MRGVGRRPRRVARSYIGGIWIEEDQAVVAVCSAPDAADACALRFDRETSAGDVARTIAEAEALLGGTIEWTVAFGGGDVLHEVVVVPPQVRAFREVRLDACLAGTSWGSVEAVAAAGYQLSHVFDGDVCLVGVASEGTLVAVRESIGAAVRLTSAAAALAELLRAVERDTFEPGGPAALALLCGASSIAACIVENGDVRLLHQASLAAYVREMATTAPQSVPDGPLEFELGGGYSVPQSARRFEREAESGALETGAYQAAVTKVVQDVLALYREQYGTAVDFPRRLLLTGEAVSRHAMLAFASRYLGSQFEVEELDAALLVRIDEAETARRFAALQSLFGGALAAVASGARPDALAFAPVADAAERAGRKRAATGRSWWTPRRLAVAAVAIGIVVVGLGARLALVASDARTLAAAHDEERTRSVELSAVTAERKQVEARFAHTRDLLAALSSLRGRQAIPPELLATIAECLPADVELDEIELKGAALRLSGRADDRELGTRLALALEQRREAFADIVPQTDTKVVKEVHDETGETYDRVVYTFAITARYARNAVAPGERAATGEKEP